MTTQFPCHTCGKLGHWMDDCPHNKSSKPSVSINATDKVNESATAKKSNKRGKKHVKFANLTVEETIAFDDCNLSMLTHAISLVCWNLWDLTLSITVVLII